MTEKENKFFRDRTTFVYDILHKERTLKYNKKLQKQKLKKSNTIFNKYATIIIIILTFLGVVIASIFGYLSYIIE